MPVVKQQDTLDVFMKTQWTALHNDIRAYKAAQDATDALPLGARDASITQWDCMHKRISAKSAILGSLQ
jgi:hypothetical protein